MLVPQNYRLLIVDDLFDNLFLLQTLLESEGYLVELADSGTLALAKIAASPPDLVLLDVMMPQMNGLEVLEKIRQNKQLPFIPIVLVTGAQNVSLINLSAIEADGLLMKPISFEEVLSQINLLLQLKEKIDWR